MQRIRDRTGPISDAWFPTNLLPGAVCPLDSPGGSWCVPWFVGLLFAFALRGFPPTVSNLFIETSFWRPSRRLKPDCDLAHAIKCSIPEIRFASLWLEVSACCKSCRNPSIKSVWPPPHNRSKWENGSPTSLCAAVLPPSQAGTSTLGTQNLVCQSLLRLNFLARLLGLGWIPTTKRHLRSMDTEDPSSN